MRAVAPKGKGTKQPVPIYGLCIIRGPAVLIYKLVGAARRAARWIGVPREDGIIAILVLELTPPYRQKHLKYVTIGVQRFSLVPLFFLESPFLGDLVDTQAFLDGPFHDRAPRLLCECSGTTFAGAG